jgi:hypothetical protein
VPISDCCSTLPISSLHARLKLRKPDFSLSPIVRRQNMCTNIGVCDLRAAKASRAGEQSWLLAFEYPIETMRDWDG